MWENEVNRSTNEKVIAKHQNFKINCKRTMLNIKVIWRSRSWCYMMVNMSWPKQHCVWVWSKSIENQKIKSY